MYNYLIDDDDHVDKKNKGHKKVHDQKRNNISG